MFSVAAGHGWQSIPVCWVVMRQCAYTSFICQHPACQQFVHAIMMEQRLTLLKVHTMRCREGVRYVCSCICDLQLQQQSRHLVSGYHHAGAG